MPFNDTDDSASVAEGHGSGYGISWIRGTFLSRDDLPPLKLKKSN